MGDVKFIHRTCGKEMILEWASNSPSGWSDVDDTVVLEFKCPKCGRVELRK